MSSRMQEQLTLGTSPELGRLMFMYHAKRGVIFAFCIRGEYAQLRSMSTPATGFRAKPQLAGAAYTGSQQLA